MISMMVSALLVTALMVCYDVKGTAHARFSFEHPLLLEYDGLLCDYDCYMLLQSVNEVNSARDGSSTFIVQNNSLHSDGSFSSWKKPRASSVCTMCNQSESSDFTPVVNRNQFQNKKSRSICKIVEPLEVVIPVQNLTANVLEITYLLARVLNSKRNTGNQQQFSKTIIQVSSNIIQQDVISHESHPKKKKAMIVGSSLLSALDQLPLMLSEDMNVSTGNIVFSTHQLSDQGEATTLVTSIDSKDFASLMSFPRMSLQVPLELVHMFANVSGNENDGVRVSAFLYYDVKDFFPSGRQRDSNTELVSGIVSTSLLCGDKRCPTEDMQLNTPVQVYFEHSDAVKENMKNKNTDTICVFWEFLSGKSSSQDTGILSIGQWSDQGCERNESLSNSSMTVCECSHLTHFAILLSPHPLNISEPVSLSFQIIGYVGVSISLVAMAITVVTFLALKALHNLRNFVHVNLCISLGIAQLIFVIGVTRADPTVPIHCQITAVLLHYFFLVSFMWMLMEGVVLYILLVKVFVLKEKNHKIAFVLVSYCVPMLYVGFLALPLGFALPNQPNYGYSTACFLNPSTGFVWAFIVPVMVIIFINIGFFIMAAVIMWRHKKKQTRGLNKKNVKVWFVATLSLLVIMGVTWIIGIFIVKVEALLPLAYIYTILVSFQGLFIFLIIVVSSKQVREEYTKWWRARIRKSSVLRRYFGGRELSSAGQMVPKSNMKNGIETRGNSKELESNSESQHPRVLLVEHETEMTATSNQFGSEGKERSTAT